MFFAEEFPASHIVPEQAVTIVTVIWTLSAIAAALAGLAFLVLALRRRPPIEAEFATKAELGALRTEILATSTSIFSKLEAMTSGMNAEFSSLNRSLGKLEGQKDLAHQIVEAIKR